MFRALGFRVFRALGLGLRVGSKATTGGEFLRGDLAS